MSAETTRVYTAEDYKAAARANLWAAKMRRLHGDRRASEVHADLASLYVQQELRRART